MKRSATSYTWPVIASVLLHGALVALIVVGWTPSSDKRRVIQPKYVEATLLTLDPAKVPQIQDKPKEDKAAQEQERQRQEAVRRQQEQARREQQAKEEAARKAKAEAERKAKIEAERKAKALAEQKAREEAERKRQEELKRQQAEKARQEKLRREQELARALATEQAAQDSAASAETIGSYSGYIQDRIASNWSRPPSARLGMEVELDIQLDGQARVISVVVVKSSGNAAFDRSAEQAVRRVEQFNRLKELDRSTFERNFRRFTLVFRPEDLRF